MDLRNKTTSEFKIVLDSPLGVPNSQVQLYRNDNGSYIWYGNIHVEIQYIALKTQCWM